MRLDCFFPHRPMWAKCPPISFLGGCATVRLKGASRSPFATITAIERSQRASCDLDLSLQVSTGIAQLSLHNSFCIQVLDVLEPLASASS